MLSQDRCTGMDSGRGPRLSQHSLPAGDLLDARLAFMFSRTAQRIGSASVGTNLFLEGAQCEPRIHFGGAGQSGLLGQAVTFGWVRLGVVDGLGGHVQPVFQVGKARDIPVADLFGLRHRVPETIGLRVRGSGSRAELAKFFGKRCHRGVRFMQSSKRDLDRGACLTMLLIQLALGETEPITCMTGFGEAPLGVINGRLQLDECWGC
jgi:hypothetical protein